jgi:thiol-disulfide isomerase/thioredoxin
MRSIGFRPLLCLTVFGAIAGSVESADLATGPWRAWLESPGGELPFEIEIVRDGDVVRAWMINGTSKTEVPRVEFDGKQLTLAIEQYDSRIVAAITADGKRMHGEWSKTGSKGKLTRMAFHAVAGEAQRFPRSSDPAEQARSCSAIGGRWRVEFSQADEPAVGQFDCHEDGAVTGTFLTTTGDYGYLAGVVDGNAIKLSCFDGAHAFLFQAAIGEDGSLAGDFWSRDAWHETWTAKRDPGVTLPDAFTLTKWSGKLNLSDLTFTALDGKPTTLADPALAGKARIIEIFGSWCPNCHDAASLLGELHERYRDRGLSVVGLAFELTDDQARNLEQVRKYVGHHRVRYPILLAGLADKDEVKKALPLLDRFRAYPTTIFVDRDGEVLAIHIGFSGPATGEAHQTLRREFVSRIESMLDR